MRDYKPIPNLPGYYATSRGDILSFKKGRAITETPCRILKARVQNNGYFYVRMPRAWTSVHRLVCMAWHGESPFKGSEVRHINGRKFDNRAINLAWCSSTNQNWRDRVRHGSGVKLSCKKVREIRLLLMRDVSMSDCARLYSVSYHTIYYIAQGMTWRRQSGGLNKEFREWQRSKLMPKSSPNH